MLCIGEGTHGDTQEDKWTQVEETNQMVNLTLQLFLQ